MIYVAVISEFNPFHNGHVILLNEIRKRYGDCTVVAVMSGNTVQRGEFAIFEKYQRARAAVENGYDLVCELPFPFSCSAGEQFAKAGTFIADALGCDVLAFGSESGDANLLIQYANNLNSDGFYEKYLAIQKNDRTVSAIEAREKAYLESYGASLPDTGNDILGIEYLRAVSYQGLSLEPCVIRRTEKFSATESRRAVFSGSTSEMERLMPAQSIERGRAHRGLRGLEKLIIGRLLTEKSNESSVINAFKNCARNAQGYDDFIAQLPTKTYTAARLRRELIGYLCNVGDAEKNLCPEFTVLLAANENGLAFLKNGKKQRRIAVLTKRSDAKELSEIGSLQLEQAELAHKMYRLADDENGTADYFQKPYFKKLIKLK